MLFALPENFRLGGKWLTLTNPLAYCDSELKTVTNKVAAPFTGLELVTKKKKEFYKIESRTEVTRGQVIKFRGHLKSPKAFFADLTDFWLFIMILNVVMLSVLYWVSSFSLSQYWLSLWLVLLCLSSCSGYPVALVIQLLWLPSCSGYPVALSIQLICLSSCSVYPVAMLM